MAGSNDQVPLRLGPYELLELVATGGMAEVYLAQRAGPHGFQKLVAVKRILPQLAKDVDFVSMFVDEARVCARLSHPCVVQVFDFGEEEGELYMAMEYVDGTTAARLIRAAATENVEIPLDACLHVALSVLRGLEYAHALRDAAGKPLTLVHRDVSPGNVLIDRSGAVKLTDFGIARAAELERRTDAGQLKGKLGYMSPEQVVGRELDARSDLFTLAIVLAEMVILRPVFSGGSDMDVLLRIRDADLGALDRAQDRLPGDLKAILFRALAKDPSMRYGSARAFAAALEDLVRRRRLQVGPGKVAACIERLGLAPNELIDPITGEVSRRTTEVLSYPPAKEDGRESVRPPGSGDLDVSPRVYRTREPHGAVAGPMSYPRLVELFATGRLNRQALVARESSEFKPATSYPELSRFISSPALVWDDEFPRDARRRGPLDRATLPAYLVRLAQERATGMIYVAASPVDAPPSSSEGAALAKKADRKKVYLVEGVPEFVASTEKKELLGELLIARGQVLRMELEMALAMLPRSGGRVGDALVGLGVLRAVELFRAIHDQTQSRYAALFRCTAAEIGFVEGARSQEETFPLGVDPFDLIARGVRAGYSQGELRALLARLGDAAIEVADSPPVRAESFRLTDREAGVLGAVASRPMPLARLIAERCVHGEADVEEVLRAVFLGLSCGLLRSSRWT